MDLETDIQDEIAACENTQNWTGGKAIRKSHTSPVIDLPDAQVGSTCTGL